MQKIINKLEDLDRNLETTILQNAIEDIDFDQKVSFSKYRKGLFVAMFFMGTLSAYASYSFDSRSDAVILALVSTFSSQQENLAKMPEIQQIDYNNNSLMAIK